MIANLQPVTHNRRYRIGTAGWTIPREFAERVAGEGTHLERYARVLKCSEINSSFHRSHRASTWTKWGESVPGEFRFSVKVPKQWTHVAGLKIGADEVRRFAAEAKLLGAKLGPLLVQLPPKLEFDARVAGKFFEVLRAEFGGRVVCEPRHASWFNDDADKSLREWQVARVAADPAVVPEAFTPGGDTSIAYYRLHGSPRKYYSSYDENFLRDLATRMREIDATEVWCILDNTASGAALGNALETLSLVVSRCR